MEYYEWRKLNRELEVAVLSVPQSWKTLCWLPPLNTAPLSWRLSWLADPPTPYTSSETLLPRLLIVSSLLSSSLQNNFVLLLINTWLKVYFPCTLKSNSGFLPSLNGSHMLKHISRMLLLFRCHLGSNGADVDNTALLSLFCLYGVCLCLQINQCKRR